MSIIFSETTQTTLHRIGHKTEDWMHLVNHALMAVKESYPGVKALVRSVRFRQV